MSSLDNLIADNSKLSDENRELKKENKRLKEWVNDLQSKMYINCVYCGHRYGPNDEVPASMAQVLKDHIEECSEHPMSKLKRDLKKKNNEIKKLKEIIRELDEKLDYEYKLDEERNLNELTREFCDRYFDCGTTNRAYDKMYKAVFQLMLEIRKRRNEIEKYKRTLRDWEQRSLDLEEEFQRYKTSVRPFLQALNKEGIIT